MGPIPILRIGTTLICSVHIELRDDTAAQFQEDVLTRIEHTGACGLVIDISGLDTVDSYVARMLLDVGRMARLMGTETILVGMRPETAATLVRMGYPMADVRTALDLDHGLGLLAKKSQAKTGGGALARACGDRPPPSRRVP